MDLWMIILLVLLGVIVVLLLATTPMMRRREGNAVGRAKELLGGEDAMVLVQARVVGFGSEPVDAGGLKGMGVLAASADEIVFVTWAPLQEFRIERSRITGVDSRTSNPRDAHKAMIDLRFRDDEHGEVTASFRLPGAVEWLDELGYEWPADDAVDEEP